MPMVSIVRMSPSTSHVSMPGIHSSSPPNCPTSAHTSAGGFAIVTSVLPSAMSCSRVVRARRVKVVNESRESGRTHPAL